MQTHLKPKQDHGERQHGSVAICPLLVASCHPAKLLQAIDQTLHLVSLAIEFSIKWAGRMLVLLPGDRRANPTSVQVLTKFSVSVAFIPRDPLGTEARATDTTPDRTLFQKLLGHSDLMLLAGS
jgi:hypothetical protein